MAKIVKGEIRNPNGRPKANKEVAGVRELTRHNLMVIMNKYMYRTRGELKDLLKDDSLTVIESMVIRLMAEVTAKGKDSTFDTLIDRVIGKTPLRVENHNYDETKSKVSSEAEKILLKILLDEKTETMEKEFVKEGLLKKEE
jgi:hypothetical protein